MIRLSPAADSVAWVEVPAEMVGGEKARVGLRWLSTDEREELDRVAKKAATTHVEQWTGKPGEGAPEAAPIKLVPHLDFYEYSGRLVELTLGKQVVEWEGFDMKPGADAMLALRQGFSAAAHWIYRRGLEHAHWGDGVPLARSGSLPNGSATTPRPPVGVESATRPG